MRAVPWPLGDLMRFSAPGCQDVGRVGPVAMRLSGPPPTLGASGRSLCVFEDGGYPDCPRYATRTWSPRAVSTRHGWLRDVAVRYWGDVDTHGMAILAEVRRALPHVRSALMDLETLQDHRHMVTVV